MRMTYRASQQLTPQFCGLSRRAMQTWRLCKLLTLELQSIGGDILPQITALKSQRDNIFLLVGQEQSSRTELWAGQASQNDPSSRTDDKVEGGTYRIQSQDCW